MKRFICLILALLLAFSCISCAGEKETDPNSAVFYYVRTAFYDNDPESFPHGSMDSLIAGESRDITGRAGDIKQILSLYLNGPAETELTAPFPPKLSLVDVVVTDGSATVTLSNVLTTLTGVDLTVACACITLTCLALAEADSVTIRSQLPVDKGGVSVTMTAADLVLLDVTTPESAEPTE